MNQHYKDTGVEVIAVIDGADRDGIANFKDEFKTSYTILADPKNSVWNLYELRTNPTTIILDKSGIVRYVGGFTTWAEIEEQVEAIKGSEATDTGTSQSHQSKPR